jgi:hypothetical protein
MSIQSEIESALSFYVSFSITGIVMTRGPISNPRAEGSTRVGSIRKTNATGNRIDFAQTAWSDLYALTVFWSPTIARDTAITEWEAFVLAITQDPQLSLQTIPQNVETCFLISQLWGEAVDMNFRTMSAVIQVERVE